MKKLDVNIKDSYRMYHGKTEYHFDGDLIILSGVNGSGKSQLLKIISQNTGEAILRTVLQTSENGDQNQLEDVLLLSFRDNINLGEDFGHYSAMYKEEVLNTVWNFYSKNILSSRPQLLDARNRERFDKGTLSENIDGTRNTSWRSINRLVKLIKDNFPGEKAFHLSKTEIESILPPDFIWRNENDIISQVGNLFYIACCERVDKQIECSKSTKVFDNSEWLKNAPWTILNTLFKQLRFKYRFKTDYRFVTPNLEENPQLRDGNDIRGIMDLSDGEKAILKLALISLDEEISKDIKLVLFDEYDAPLNPSLTEAFYHVLDEFYIKKGIQVIVATHSPATLSLAPDYAQFYEIFNQNGASPKIVPVNQYDYAELRVANKRYYDKLYNQEERISELEKMIDNKDMNSLFVEDKYKLYP